MSQVQNSPALPVQKSVKAYLVWNVISRQGILKKKSQKLILSLRSLTKSKRSPIKKPKSQVQRARKSWLYSLNRNWGLLIQNPRKKYIIDLTTNKKYVYENLQRGEFGFTEDGLSFTIFYSEYDGNIPSAELGFPTADLEYSNKIFYSNVEYLRSIPQETDHDLPDDQGDLQSDQETDHGLPDDQGILQGDQETDHGLPDDQGDLQKDQGGNLGPQDKLDEHQQQDDQEPDHDFDIQKQSHTDTNTSQNSNEEDLHHDSDDKDTKNSDEYSNI